MQNLLAHIFVMFIFIQNQVKLFEAKDGLFMFINKAVLTAIIEKICFYYKSFKILVIIDILNAF